MAEDIRHECGVAALYALREAGPIDVVPRMPGLLLDLQTRGQLACGLTSYDPASPQILSSFKDVGTVSEVLQLSRAPEHQALLERLRGRAAIGHTRYATTGRDDRRYAQPFERSHGRLWKWFSFAFNGTLANYGELRDQLLQKEGYHFALDTDTEIVMHTLAYHLRGEKAPDLVEVMAAVAEDFDGAYCIAFLDAQGRMFVARDPLGIRPMSFAVADGVLGAANETAALRNAGFDDIHTLEPGEMLIVEDGKLRIERFARAERRAHCFFEWVYFSSVASEIDGKSVYRARAEAGRRLAQREDQPLDRQCIVVPVPDTAKAAADAFAFELGIPCVEGIIRNRYVGRTFIQPDSSRGSSARRKYTPLPSVLANRRVFLVEDSVVRSTTLKTLARRLREVGQVSEIHVRVACPPIVSPCFYGIDMSTIGELFAPSFLEHAERASDREAAFARMAEAIGVDSLRYLGVDDLGPTIDIDPANLCQGCVTATYPTPWGNQLRRQAEVRAREGSTGRVFGGS